MRNTCIIWEGGGGGGGGGSNKDVLLLLLFLFFFGQTRQSLYSKRTISACECIGYFQM